MRCFGGRAEGFYIDIGSGHPVYDNMSFAFYLKGWSGITVEPNPWLARLTRAVRPRDRHLEALVGAARGRSHLLCGERLPRPLDHDRRPCPRGAKRSSARLANAIDVPVTTLKELCEQHAPRTFDFLKVDVEGAERDVLLNGDWQNYRPRWWWSRRSPLTRWRRPGESGSRFSRSTAIVTSGSTASTAITSPKRRTSSPRCFETAPAAFDQSLQFRNVKPALARRRRIPIIGWRASWPAAP